MFFCKCLLEKQQVIIQNITTFPFQRGNRWPSHSRAHRSSVQSKTLFRKDISISYILKQIIMRLLKDIHSNTVVLFTNLPSKPSSWTGWGIRSDTAVLGMESLRGTYRERWLKRMTADRHWWTWGEWNTHWRQMAMPMTRRREGNSRWGTKMRGHKIG